MANRPDKARVTCPFYQHSTGQSVTCEGIIPGTSMVIRFASPKKRERHQTKYCEKQEKRCPLAVMISYRYEREERKKG